MKYKRDKEGYIYRTCIVCDREFGTHPLTYKAKAKKDVCLDCFMFRQDEYLQKIKG